MFQKKDIVSDFLPKEIEEDKTKQYVYVRTNIRKRNKLYIYDETLYRKDEYDTILINKNNYEQDFLIVTLYELIINSIGAVTLNESFNTPLINTYARLVNAKIKTINDIPNNFKEEVRKINNAY